MVEQNSVIKVKYFGCIKKLVFYIAYINAQEKSF